MSQVMASVVWESYFFFLYFFPSSSQRLLWVAALWPFWVTCHLSLFFTLSCFISMSPQTCPGLGKFLSYLRAYSEDPYPLSEKPLPGGPAQVPRALASLRAGCPVLLSDGHLFCLLGWHLWTWSKGVGSSLVQQSQLLPLSWGKHTKETAAHKMFKNVFVIVLHTCLLFLCKS